MTQITAAATQGRYGSSDWQTAYQLMFSDTGHNWKQYRQEGSKGAFPGNSNADSVVQHKLQHLVIARFIRLIPLDWNPNGRIGLRLEVYGCPYNSDTVRFDGHSSLFFRLSPGLKQASAKGIQLKFKTMTNSGTVFHTEGPNEHSLTLELEKGRLLLRLRKGGSLSLNTQHVVSLGSLLDDQHWHLVAVEHHSNHLNFTVDKSTMLVEIPPCANRNFHGCLENLVYHGLNLVSLTKQEDQRVTVKVNWLTSEKHVSVSASTKVLYLTRCAQIYFKIF
uniref:Contactin-associated protein-like 4 n=1 Tax=Kryptolebias marmoratus TaxID=37003 RepID=A0A3Q3GC27_KRYMA